MISRRSAIYLLTGCTSVAVHCEAFGKPETVAAPLGLQWGAPSEDIRHEGIELKAVHNTDYGVSFTAVKMSKSLSDQEGAMLSFGMNDALWRILIFSRNYANDPSGVALIARYAELSASLKEKYGKPRIFHRLGDSIYSESRYFLSGIRGGDTKWFSNFSTADLNIQIGLSASDGSTGSWHIIYEYKPLEAAFEKSKKSSEKDKL